MSSKKPQDIKGLSFSFVAGDSLHQLWPAILAGAGLKETEVKTVFAPSGPTKIQLMLQGKVDGTPGYVIMQPYLLERESGRKTSTMMYSEFGVNTMSQGILVHAEMIQKNPDLIKRFMRATQKSWSEATKNLEAATSRAVPDWLVLHKDSFKGTLARLPSRDEIQPIANEQAIVEFYSR